MKNVPIFRFGKLVEPVPGCGYGKYVGHSLRAYGRQFIMDAINSNPKNLKEDPWDFGCGDPEQD